MSLEAADRRLLAAIATRMGEVSAALGTQQMAFGGAKDELRELTDAFREVSTRLESMQSAGDKRGAQTAKLFDRLTRLTLVQAGAMLMAALSVPVALAGTVLAIRDPAMVLQTVVVLVDAIPFVEVTPHREAPDATP